MRKFMLLFVAMLTTSSPAWASGGLTRVDPDPIADPEPDLPSDAAPTSDRPAQRRASIRFQRTKLREALSKHEAAREHKLATAEVAVSPQLQAIAQCESGGDPSAVGGGGQFRGKYQFTFDTWAAVGGTGDPANAPEAEQDRRAAALYAQSGPGQWPVCGQ
jgi:transglycosylase-like protein